MLYELAKKHRKSAIAPALTTIYLLASSKFVFLKSVEYAVPIFFEVSTSYILYLVGKRVIIKKKIVRDKSDESLINNLEKRIAYLKSIRVELTESDKELKESADSKLMMLVDEWHALNDKMSLKMKEENEKLESDYQKSVNDMEGLEAEIETQLFNAEKEIKNSEKPEKN